MKRKLILLLVVIVMISGFGSLLHSPPSIIDVISCATPKAKKNAQTLEKLEGDYIFCINSSIDSLSDEDVRQQLKEFVSGQTDVISTDAELSFNIYISETDYALSKYSDSLCERLSEVGVDANIKRYSDVFLRSRVVNEKYEVFISNSNLISTDSLINADFIIMNSKEMRR